MSGSQERVRGSGHMLLYTYHAFRDGVAAAVGVLEQGIVQADARVAININCKKKALFLVFVLYLFCKLFLAKFGRKTECLLSNNQVVNE